MEVGVAAAFTKTGLFRHDTGRSPRYSSSKASITFLPMIDMNPPPTSAAASYQSARVYLQVQQWMGKRDDMDPEEWGWVRVRNRLEPRMTDLQPAPEALLKVVRCTCKHDCDTRRCTCKKHGLVYAAACGEYKSISSTNSPMLPTEEFDGTH